MKLILVMINYPEMKLLKNCAIYNRNVKPKITIDSIL